MADLGGKTALVTGGARGLGYMMAKGLLEAGATVVITSRREDAGEAARAELAAYGDVSAIRADLSVEAECQRVADEASRRHSGVDVLVNNAGATWGAPLESFESVGWDKVLDLNLKAPFYLTRSLLPLLTARARADSPSRVINIGSIDGLQVPDHPNYSYSASKAALHHLTRVLARELAARHVLVNAVAAGPFATKMMDKVIAEQGDRVLMSSPLRRLGRAEDIAGIAVFLSGPASTYITGAVIPVDGGISTTLASGWLGSDEG